MSDDWQHEEIIDLIEDLFDSEELACCTPGSCCGNHSSHYLRAYFQIFESHPDLSFPETVWLAYRFREMCHLSECKATGTAHDFVECITDRMRRSTKDFDFELYEETMRIYRNRP